MLHNKNNNSQYADNRGGNLLALGSNAFLLRVGFEKHLKDINPRFYLTAQASQQMLQL